LWAPRSPQGVDFYAVIHKLWITLWITMLIACKDWFYDLEL
jgi:hypothetical protein